MNTMTLTEVSFYSRRFLPFAVFACVLLIIMFYAMQALLGIIFAPPPAVVYTNPVFGKVKIPLIKTASSSAGLNFTLDTVEGQPITATDAAKVYFLPESTTRLGFREKIYLMAQTLGFDTEITKHVLDGTDAVFTDERQKLNIDITNFNFLYQYQLTKDDPALLNTRIPDENEIRSKASNYLISVGRYPEELAQGKTNIVYLNFNPNTNEMGVAESPQSANAVEVDFYRPDLDQYPIVSPDYYNSQNYVVIIFNDSGDKVIKAQVRYFEKSSEQVGVYPLKTGNQAWQDLKNGKGMVVQSSAGLTDVLIKKMFFAYLDPDVYQQYLEPVYVFLGPNNFVAYVPAIAEAYESQ